MPAYNEAENIRDVVASWYPILDGKGEIPDLSLRTAEVPTVHTKYYWNWQNSTPNCRSFPTREDTMEKS